MDRAALCFPKEADFLLEGCGQLVELGEEFGKAAKEGMRVFKNVDEVKAALKAEPVSNCTILIKGSNSTTLHQLPAAFE